MIQDQNTLSLYDSKSTFFLSVVIPDIKWAKINEKISPVKI